MTRKDLFRIIYSYKGLLEEKDKLEKSVAKITDTHILTQSNDCAPNTEL